MNRKIRFMVTVEVPPSFGPVNETDLMALCSLKHQKLLNGDTSITVSGGELDDNDAVSPGRRGWKRQVYKVLRDRSPRRLGSGDVAERMGISATQFLDRKALAEMMTRMAKNGTIKRERQAGSQEWSYWA